MAGADNRASESSSIGLSDVVWGRAPSAALAEPPSSHSLPLVDPTQPDSPWWHPPSAVHLLRQWEQVRAEGSYRYDANGENISVRYGVHASLVFSVFVFRVATGPRESVLAAAFAQSVREMLSSLSRPEDAADQMVGLARPHSIPLRGRRVSALGTPPGPRATPCISLVEMFAHEGWILKFRVTAVPKAMELSERFRDAWFARSRFAETGTGDEDRWVRS